MNRRLYPAIVAAAVALAVGGAYAATSSKENDALAISTAKIGLSQAVSAAEQHVGGKASRAEYERHKGQWVFDVEVVKDKTVTDLKVDPATGKVIAATEDKADRDDDNDHAG
jgi:uncharacterized membrane protein YkoI